MKNLGSFWLNNQVFKMKNRFMTTNLEDHHRKNGKNTAELHICGTEKSTAPGEGLMKSSAKCSALAEAAQWSFVLKIYSNLDR